MYDSADLLARCKRQADVPDVDEGFDNDDWYALLSEAQVYWAGQLAAHVPESQYVTELLTTVDAGISYQFAHEPLGAHIEIRSGRDGSVLIPGPDWDAGADLVIGRNPTTGQSEIHFPGGKARPFANGLYARYAPMPDAINGTTPPSLMPTNARALLVPRACYLWASRPGSLTDPQKFLTLEAHVWGGNPDSPGDVGILGLLKQQMFLSGTAAIGQGGGNDWMHHIDTGQGYTPERL